MISQRAKVVERAKQWIGTPFCHHARSMGGGVDCFQLIVDCNHWAGVLTDEEAARYQELDYTIDHHIHRVDEVYLAGLLNHCIEVAEPALGDVAIWRFSHTFHHCAIVLTWPRAIHALHPKPVQEYDASRFSTLKTVCERGMPDYGKPRPVKFFSPRVWHCLES